MLPRLSGVSFCPASSSSSPCLCLCPCRCRGSCAANFCPASSSSACLCSACRSRRGRDSANFCLASSSSSWILCSACRRCRGRGAANLVPASSSWCCPCSACRESCRRGRCTAIWWPASSSSCDLALHAVVVGVVVPRTFARHHLAFAAALAVLHLGLHPASAQLLLDGCAGDRGRLDILPVWVGAAAALSCASLLRTVPPDSRRCSRRCACCA